MKRNRKVTPKWSILVLTVLCLTLLFAGCSNKKSNEDDKTTENKTYQNLYSKGFSIEYLDDGIKKVTDGEGRELVLVPKSLGTIPEEYKDSTIITTPVENAVFLSTTQVGMLRAVDSEEVWDAVGGVSGKADWSSIDAVKTRLESGKIKNIGDDSSNPDYEVIQELNPDVVFVYTGTSPQTDAIAKLDELGINYAVDNEYMEDNYLARMEWMRFILTFYNQDDEVENIMNNAQATVDSVKKTIDGMDKPKVAIFGVYSGGACYVTPDEKWVGSMLKDMGGINVFSGITESKVTLEELYDRVQDADIIVYTSTPSYTPDMQSIIDVFPMLTDCKAYKDDKIYQYSNSFWMGIDQSDVMASDLAAVIYPEQFKDRSLGYFLQMSK